MNNELICIFDLDGTLYPKDSAITHSIRNSVIDLISRKTNITHYKAADIYYSLPSKYANPYHGLGSVGITAAEYHAVFDEIDVAKYMKPDLLLQSLLTVLSRVFTVRLLTFSSEKYAQNMLRSIGVERFFQDIICVTPEMNYEKSSYYRTIIDTSPQNVFVIGDDYINDILPALKIGFNAYHISFDNETSDIYHVIANLISKTSPFSIPRTMRIETSSLCNEKCIICPYESITRSHGKMKFELFKKLVAEHSSSVDNPALIFPASVGEPFLDVDFLKFVSYASQYYTSISTFSNGSLLSEDLVKAYIESGGTELMLTLHGFTESNHQMITKTKTYNAVKNNIMNASRINSKYGYPIKIYLDIYSDTHISCDDEWIAELAANHVLLSLAPMSSTHNWGGKIHGSSSSLRTKKCNRIFSQFGVQYNGDVVACCADINGDYILGNANNNSLSDIFNQYEYTKLFALNQNTALSLLPTCAICNIN